MFTLRATAASTANDTNVLGEAANNNLARNVKILLDFVAGERIAPKFFIFAKVFLLSSFVVRRVLRFGLYVSLEIIPRHQKNLYIIITIIKSAIIFN